MPSPRSSPAMRPQSPLSPRFESSGRFDALQLPSPRSMTSRTGNSQRRANTTSIKLPSLPRFHPANYPSANSSMQTTPDGSNLPSPQPPLSPRAHQRVFSDAQKHLFVYQREMISVAARASSPIQIDKPDSPRLAPMGSPGPVTPFELEDGEGYLVSGARGGGDGDVSSEELIEKLIREETSRRMRSRSPAPPTSR